MNISKNNIKKKRIKVSNIDEFFNILDHELIKEKGIDDISQNNYLEKHLSSNITYIAENIEDLLDYFKKIDIFENNHKRLCEIIKDIDILNIYRLEYDRKACVQEDVDEIIKIIEGFKNDISFKTDIYEMRMADEIEKELDEEYIYTKDIELLKKMILFENTKMDEEYNADEKVNRISVKIKDNISNRYFPVEKGSIEYHQHLNNNIPRLKRLIKNLHKYISIEDDNKSISRINQSEALNDSINIAAAVYDNKKYKAISGSNEVLDYCTSPGIDKAEFISYKVNKLGKLGTGYNRINDSEKKILERIHKEIEEKKVRDDGELVLYSKWEPCPSCYYVMYQFCKIHPKIKVKVKYFNKYGEKI